MIKAALCGQTEKIKKGEISLAWAAARWQKPALLFYYPLREE